MTSLYQPTSGPLGSQRSMGGNNSSGWGPVSSSGMLSNPLLSRPMPQQSQQPQWGPVSSSGQLSNPQLRMGQQPAQQQSQPQYSPWGGSAPVQRQLYGGAQQGQVTPAQMPNMSSMGGMPGMQRPQMTAQPSFMQQPQQMNQGPLGMGGQYRPPQQAQPQQAQYGVNMPGMQKLSGNVRMMSGY